MALNLDGFIADAEILNENTRNHILGAIQTFIKATQSEDSQNNPVANSTPVKNSRSPISPPTFSPIPKDSEPLSLFNIRRITEDENSDQENENFNNSAAIILSNCNNDVGFVPSSSLIPKAPSLSSVDNLPTINWKIETKQNSNPEEEGNLLLQNGIVRNRIQTEDQRAFALAIAKRRIEESDCNDSSLERSINDSLLASSLNITIQSDEKTFVDLENCIEKIKNPSQIEELIPQIVKELPSYYKLILTFKLNNHYKKDANTAQKLMNGISNFQELVQFVSNNPKEVLKVDEIPLNEMEQLVLAAQNRIKNLETIKDVLEITTPEKPAAINASWTAYEKMSEAKTTFEQQLKQLPGILKSYVNAVKAEEKACLEKNKNNYHKTQNAHSKATKDLEQIKKSYGAIMEFLSTILELLETVEAWACIANPKGEKGSPQGVARLAFGQQNFIERAKNKLKESSSQLKESSSQLNDSSNVDWKNVSDLD